MPLPPPLARSLIASLLTVAATLAACNPIIDSKASAPGAKGNHQTLDSGGQTLASGRGRSRESFGDDALARAQGWVDEGVMYSFDPSWEGYRTDCSGLVSYAWGLAAPGHTTYSLAGGPWDDGASYVISWDDLAPGDALNFPGDPDTGTGHVMLFAGWDDRAAGTLFVYEEYNFGHPAEYRRHGLDDHWAARIRDYLPIRSARRPASDGNSSTGTGTPMPGSGSASCPSSTLGADQADGTCVQSALDAAWYQCTAGAWLSYDGSSAGPAGPCATRYPFCPSGTLGRDVPARTCVESKFDRQWYQCGADGAWQGAPAAASDGSGPLGICLTVNPL